MLNVAVALVSIAVAQAQFSMQDAPKVIEKAPVQMPDLFPMDLFEGVEDGTFGCRFQCVMEAAAAYRQCIRDGGTREECRMVFRMVYEACLETCEPSCEELCYRAAREVYRDCRAAGGNMRECARLAHEALLDCLEGCQP